MQDQKNIKDLGSAIMGSGANLSVVAAVIALLALILPFVGVRVGLGEGLENSRDMTGFSAAGWVAWPTLLAFAAPVAARRIPAMMPYRNLTDGAAAGMAAIVMICAWAFNPVASELRQVRTMGGFETHGYSYVTYYPHIGMFFLLLAIALLALAFLKDRGSTHAKSAEDRH